MRPAPGRGAAVSGKAGAVSSRQKRNRDAEVEAARVEMEEKRTVEPLPALPILAERFGLSRFEQNVLLLCIAMELDTRIASLCARAQGDSARRYPTFSLAMALFDDASWEALSPERPLRYWRLLEIKMELLIQCVPAFLLALHWRGLRAGPALAGVLVGTVFALAGVAMGTHRIGGIHVGVLGLGANAAVAAAFSLMGRARR